jgi:hypothetical protein
MEHTTSIPIDQLEVSIQIEPVEIVETGAPKAGNVLLG